VLRTWTHERWLAFDVSTEKLTLLDAEPQRPQQPPDPPPAGELRRQHSEISVPQEMQVTTWGPDYRYTVHTATASAERRVQYTPSVATDICGLAAGPDGNLCESTAFVFVFVVVCRLLANAAAGFSPPLLPPAPPDGSTAISMRLFRVEPKTDRLTDLGRVGWGSGEIYQTVAGPDGKVYFGSYGGGYFGSFDPALPWNPRPGPSFDDPMGLPAAAIDETAQGGMAEGKCGDEARALVGGESPTHVVGGINMLGCAPLQQQQSRWQLTRRACRHHRRSEPPEPWAARRWDEPTVRTGVCRWQWKRNRTKPLCNNHDAVATAVSSCS
jgi:hypothetical protein